MLTLIKIILISALAGTLAIASYLIISSNLKPSETKYSQDEVIAIIHEAYKNGAQAGYTFCVNQKGGI